MSASLQLNDLPLELLGRILGHLAAVDILRPKLVNRSFRDVVSDQPHLRYRYELSAAGLSDNQDAPGTFFVRRTSLYKYRSRFDGLKPTSKASLPLGVTGFSFEYETSGDVCVIHTTSTNTLHFCRPPLESGSRPMKTWSLPLPPKSGHFAIHPPLDLIVITDNVSTRLCLRTMTTGDPHPLAANRSIKHDLWPTYMHLSCLGLMISVSDRVLSARFQGRLVLWNWRTGAKIFDNRDFHAGTIAFIWDGRLLVAEQMRSPHVVGAAPNLVLLDVSTLTDSPAVPRQVRFVCDPRYRGMRVRVMAEGAGYSDFSGVIGQDVPFYPDPSQRVLALLFYLEGGGSGMARGICVVHSETLLRLAEEIGEGVVEWDMWGKFTVAPDTDQVPGADPYTRYSVSGSRFMRVDSNETEKWAKIRVYDLSHWSRQHPDAGLDRGEELGEKWVRCKLTEAVLELPESMWSVCHAGMLQDSIVFFSFDSRHPRWDPQAQGTLDIWSFW